MSNPGSVHDITAARTHVLGALYWATFHLDLPTLTDGGYEGAGIGVHTPIKQTPCSEACAASANAGFATLTGRWRTLHPITASPSKIGDIVKAALVLTHLEHG
jgi:hypothetical protein